VEFIEGAAGQYKFDPKQVVAGVLNGATSPAAFSFVAVDAEQRRALPADGAIRSQSPASLEGHRVFIGAGNGHDRLAAASRTAGQMLRVLGAG
jgi:hypothetical protein